MFAPEHCVQLMARFRNAIKTFYYLFQSALCSSQQLLQLRLSIKCHAPNAFYF